MRILLALAISLFFPAVAIANSEDPKPPSKPKCESGFVYDKKTKTCVSSTGHSLDTDAIYQEVRALAYDGRYADAQELLAQMPAGDDRTLTYQGFTNRKMGRSDEAMSYYTQALERNPANILARAYMGQGFVADGNMAAALEQLREIRAVDGSGTWAEASLRTAIATGRSIDW